MKVLCIGHATYDIVIPVSEYPKENTKNRISNSVCCGGGPAANAAYLLSKWGVATYFSGIIGNDYEGNYIEAEFRKVGVNIEYLFKDKDYKTDNSYIIVNTTNASRTILTTQNINKHLINLQIQIKPDIILIDGHELELSKKIINENKESIVVIDAGRCTSEIIELCHMSNYIICSKKFAEDYTGSKNINLMLDKMRKDFKGEVIITLEDSGCAYYNNGIKIMKSIPTKAIDTTGAGDIFHGAFVYGITRDWDLYKKLSFASTTAGMSVTRLTGRKSIFPLEKIESVYDELRRHNFY